MKPPTSRPYRHPDDLQSVIDLILTCRAEERIDPWPPCTTFARASASMTLHDCGLTMTGDLWHSP